MIELKGLTWGHTRGFAPLAALGRVWEDFHPDQRVTWTSRSLWSFGEEPLERYLDQYDLFVFDYPFAGEALEKGWVVDLAQVMDRAALEAIRAGSVSPLFDAFSFGGRQAALPLDVATHAAAARMDLLERLGENLPVDLVGTIELARRTGKVAMPLRPTGVWGAFLSLCANSGDQPFQRRAGEPFDRDIASKVLTELTELASVVEPWCLEVYPVALLNRMANTDDIAFVPLTYGYSTYGLHGYGRNRIAFHALRNGRAHGRGAILGGSGIGVSGASRHKSEAVRHATWLTSRDMQASLYVAFGGQPAQRAAWIDPHNDAITNGFFGRLLDSADHAYVRPNFPGFHDFQNFAAGRLHQAVKDREPPGAALSALRDAWRNLAAPLPKRAS